MPSAVIYAVAAMLLIAAAPLPYGYYTFLRIVACGAFAYGSYIAYRRQLGLLPYALGFLAVLFNPVIPIHLTKALWVPIDIAAGITLFVAARHLSVALHTEGKTSKRDE